MSINISVFYLVLYWATYIERSTVVVINVVLNNEEVDRGSIRMFCFPIMRDSLHDIHVLTCKYYDSFELPITEMSGTQAFYDTRLTCA